MIGFPGETEADIRETLALMEELEPDNPTVSVLTPLPGTAIYDECERQGLLPRDDPDYLPSFTSVVPTSTRTLWSLVYFDRSVLRELLQELMAKPAQRGLAQRRRQ